MTKTPKAFRLSEQATESLKWLVAKTGTTETAIVELSLAFLKQSLENPRRGGDAVRSADNPAPQMPGQKKKRKRH
jgi:predicted DNA-binding protein